MANSIHEGCSSRAGIHAGISSGQLGGAGSVASCLVGPGSSGASPLTEASLLASTSGAVSVAVAVVSELSGSAGSSGLDTDSFAEIVASVAGIAEGVGEATEAVGGASLADSVVSVGVGS